MGGLLLLTVIILVLCSVKPSKVRGKREDCNPEVLEAFDFLMAHLDRSVEIGPIRYLKLGWVKVQLDGDVFVVKPFDGGWAGIFTEDSEQVGFWKGQRHGGWHFYSDFRNSLDGKTIRLV